MHRAKQIDTDVGGTLTVIGGIVLILGGVFARSIPFLADQGTLTRPGLIIAGAVCCLTVAIPFLKVKATPKKKDPYSR
jgi:hypothetical protein